MRYYLGLSTSGHDPALALVDETGSLLFAEATERFLQDKRAWGAMPDHPGHLAAVLKSLVPADAEFVVATSWSRTKEEIPANRSDLLHAAFEGAWLRRQQERIHRAAGDSLARHLRLADLPGRRNYEHHLCHAAFAAYSAPFDDAVCLVLDGEGDVGAVSAYRLSAGRLKRLWRSWGPGSLGALYAWITEACGFSWQAGEEWKVMGLAAFGKPQQAIADPLARILSVENGKPLFADAGVVAAAVEALEPFLRAPHKPLMEAADFAATGQQVYASLADAILTACTGQGTQNLILTGGCALNSSYNGTIVGRHDFQSVHVPCAPADDGNAAGAALLAWAQDHPAQPLPRQSSLGHAGSPFLGTKLDPREVAAAARNIGMARVTQVGSEAPERLVTILGNGSIVGVMRGEAEFGPRALGHRSILADPRPAGMKNRLNREVKGREPYRPFAPMIPAERATEWFHNAQPSPYMSFALRWLQHRQDAVPAVVHQDGTGRLQTVRKEEDPWLHGLLTRFEETAGVPILLNTSFNVMGKPIVHSVQDAMAVLVTTGLDAVLLEDVLIEKERR